MKNLFGRELKQEEKTKVQTSGEHPNRFQHTLNMHSRIYILTSDTVWRQNLGHDLRPGC